MSATKSTVFILAGTSGVGKTTLLKRALHHGIPVFGEDVDARFQAVNPARGKEMQVFEEALPTRLFQGKHVAQLLKLSERPESFVVHLDILNLLMVLVADPELQHAFPPQLRHTEPRQPQDLLDKQKNKDIFLHCLNHAFPYADTLIVNTLHLPFRRNAEQWNGRAQVLRQTRPEVDTETLRFMYDPEKPREDLYRVIHESWFEALAEVQCRAYVSKNARGMLEVKELHPKAGAVREYPYLPVNQKAPVAA